MSKKICLFVLMFCATLVAWISFADVIPYNSHYVNRCVKLQNLEIDNYRVIVENDTVTTWDVYEPNINECLKWHYKFGESRQYLLDKSIDIEEITRENIQDKAIQIWNIKVIWWYVDDSNPLVNENFVYRIIKTWNDYTLETVSEEYHNNSLENDEENDEENEKINNYELELVESEQGIDVTSWNRIMKFWIARFITILIETIILFAIAKLFRKNNPISNWRLLFVGIIASTITLPLLWFVFPLFITDWVEYTVIWELSVTLIEVFIIKYWLKVSRWKAIFASIVCNLFSYLLGLFVG